MNIKDIFLFSLYAITANRLRLFLMLLAMSIGVGAVVILTSLGEGARSYVTDQFSSLGTNLIIVLPGRTETAGNQAGMLFGKIPRDLTLYDANALNRSPYIKKIAPISIGSASISYKQLDREGPIIGTTSTFLSIRHLSMAQGKFLPETEYDRSSPVCVIGAKIKRELFINENPLGKWVRIGDRRFRVIGITASEGRSIGVDIEELVLIPVASAQALFNNPSLFRILVEAKNRNMIKSASMDTERIIRERHQGKDDVTIITQDAVLGTFDKIFTALTYTVGGIAAISLFVAGILIMNVMLVTVAQRTSEIGLLKAVGASQKQITLLFLGEAILLSFIGALFGIGAGFMITQIANVFFTDFTLLPPLWALITAMIIALTTGILFGLLPARRAARLDPVTALSRR
ncbi:MAG: ABC transporter permease [Gammaproteobacteria bacterium]|nr:ABC transporter permease [Gammaproteobacteria bacterium]